MRREQFGRNIFGMPEIIGSPWRPYEEGFKIVTEKPSQIVLKAIKEGLIKREDKVLDLGCGKNPRNAVYLAVNLNCQVVGIDAEMPQPPKLPPKIASRLSFDEKRVLEYQYPKEAFDVVVLARLIQYLPPEDLQLLMVNITQTLTPNGVLLLSYTESGGIFNRGQDYSIKAYKHPVGEVVELLRVFGFKILFLERGEDKSTNVPHAGELAVTHDLIARLAS